MSGFNAARFMTRVAFVSQAETVTGRNTNVPFTEAAGVATGTSPQAHNYQAGDRIFLSGATGANAVIYNDAKGWVIQTVPSATTFTIAIPSGTGNSAGTVVTDKPIDCLVYTLSAIQFPAAMTSVTSAVNVDLEGTNLNYVPVVDDAGTALVFANAAMGGKAFFPKAAGPNCYQGFSKMRLVVGSAEAAVRRIVFGFTLSQA
jgi:hypothetical protein